MDDTRSDDSRLNGDWAGSSVIIWQAIGPTPRIGVAAPAGRKHEWPSLLGTQTLSMRHARHNHRCASNQPDRRVMSWRFAVTGLAIQ